MHHWNLQFLAIEMFKVYTEIAPDIFYKTRINKQFKESTNVCNKTYTDSILWIKFVKLSWTMNMENDCK